MALLTACLNLVRPVGMGDDEVENWLGVAVPVVAHYRAYTLRRAVSEAQRKVDHPSKIVPTICSIADKLVPPAAPDDGWDGYELPAPRIALPAPELTTESIAALPAPLVSIGLTKGWLKRDENGELVPA